MPTRISRWPRLVWTADHARAAISHAATAGRLHQLARGIYTPNPDTTAVAEAEWAAILAREFPGAVVVDASARDGRPTAGRLLVDHPRRSRLELPGFVIEPRDGPGPVEGDEPGPGGIFLSSVERGLIDNLAVANPRLLPPDEVEQWIVDLLACGGGASLEAIRHRARVLAPRIRRQEALGRLNAIIGSVVAGRPVRTAAVPAPPPKPRRAPPSRPPRHAPAPRPAPTSRPAPARRPAPTPRPLAIEPARPLRLERFEALATALGAEPPEIAPTSVRLAARRSLLPFYEAAFSAALDGNGLTLDEAAAVVFEGDVAIDRPGEATDVRALYRLASEPRYAGRIARDPRDFLALLRSRHAVLTEHRPEAGPGRPREGIEGALLEGFAAGSALENPLARAIYMHFLVWELRPFGVGNGQLARLTMNAELQSAEMVRIIVPSGYGATYRAAMNAASRDGEFSAMAAALRHALRWTARMDFASRAAAERLLIETHAIGDPTATTPAGAELELP